MGSHGASRAGSSGGGGGTSQSGGGLPKSVMQGASRGDLQKMFAPELQNTEGLTAKQLEDVQKYQRKLAQDIMVYATTQGSDGRKANQELVRDLTMKSDKEIAAFMNERAERLTFGNDVLLPQKKAQVAAEQKDFVERQNRAVKLMNSANFKDAKWLNDPTVNVKNVGKTGIKKILPDIARAFVDGDTSQYFKKLGMEDLTDKIFK